MQHQHQQSLKLHQAQEGAAARRRQQLDLRAAAALAQQMGLAYRPGAAVAAVEASKTPRERSLARAPSSHKAQKRRPASAMAATSAAKAPSPLASARCGAAVAGGGADDEGCLAAGAEQRRYPAFHAWLRQHHPQQQGGSFGGAQDSGGGAEAPAVCAAAPLQLQHQQQHHQQHRARPATAGGVCSHSLLQPPALPAWLGQHMLAHGTEGRPQSAPSLAPPPPLQQPQAADRGAPASLWERLPLDGRAPAGRRELLALSEALDDALAAAGVGSRAAEQRPSSPPPLRPPPPGEAAGWRAAQVVGPEVAVWDRLMA